MKKKALEKRVAELERSLDYYRTESKAAHQTLAVIRQVLGPEPMSITTSAIVDDEPKLVELPTGAWLPRKKPPFIWPSSLHVVEDAG